MKTTDYLLETYGKNVEALNEEMNTLPSAVCAIATAMPVFIQLLGDVRDELVKISIALENAERS